MTLTEKLEPDEGMIFESTKTWTHNQGLSCSFRQWRANSHCRFIHGYALQVTIVFRTKELSKENWVMDFGGLKSIKAWLEENFDHKTLIAEDDPELITLRSLAEKGILDPIIVPHVGCEAFAKMIYDHITKWWVDPKFNLTTGIFVQEVEVREHEGNSARYRRDS